MDIEKKKDRLYAAIVAAASIAARLGYLIKFRSSPFYDYYPRGFDQYLLLNGAREIAAGNLLGPLASEKHSVLYKYLLAIPIYLFGGDFTAIWSVQFAAGALTAVLVYMAGRKCFGRTTGLVAGLWYGLYGPALFIEGQILREPLFCFFVILTTYLLIKVPGNTTARTSVSESESGRTGWLYASAASLSLTMQTRPTAALMFPAAVVYLWFFAYRDSEKSERAKKIIGFFVVFVLVSIPLLVRTIWVHGKFVFYDQSGPFVFLLSNIPDYYGVGWEPSALYTSFVNAHGGENALTWGMVMGRLVELYSSNPLAIFSLYARKLYFTFNSYEYPSNLNYYLFTGYSPLMSAPWSKLSAVTAAGIVGLIAGLGQQGGKRERAAVYLMFAGAFLGAIIFYPVDRFRILFVPLLIIFSAYSPVKIIQLISRRKFVKAVIAIAGIAGIFFILRMPIAPDRLVRPVDYLNWGWAYAGNPTHRDLKKAQIFVLKSFAESVKRDYPLNPAGPRLATLENYLASEEMRQGGYKAAAARLECAVSVDLCNMDLLSNLAVAFKGSGITDAAAEIEAQVSDFKQNVRHEGSNEPSGERMKGYRNALEYCRLSREYVNMQDSEIKRELGNEIIGLKKRIDLDAIDICGNLTE